MINIVVVTHGDFGEALLRTAEVMIGPQENVYVLSLLPKESPNGFGKRLDALLKGLQSQDTLILLDLFGGTPYNIAARKVLEPNIECVTGVNMAVVIEALTSRDGITLKELASKVAEAGQKSVVNLKSFLLKSGLAPMTPTGCKITRRSAKKGT